MTQKSEVDIEIETEKNSTIPEAESQKGPTIEDVVKKVEELFD